MRASEASCPVAVALEKLGICFAKNGGWNGEAVLAPLPGPPVTSYGANNPESRTA
jgi:hypothetical protein